MKLFIVGVLCLFWELKNNVRLAVENSRKSFGNVLEDLDFLTLTDNSIINFDKLLSMNICNNTYFSFELFFLISLKQCFVLEIYML